MSRHKARDMLAFLVGQHKKQPEVIQHQVATSREIPIYRRPESIQKMPRKYYQHKAKPLQVVDTTIEADISAQLKKHAETSGKRSNNSPNQRLSHKLFQRNNANMQCSLAHNSQNKIGKRKAELTPFRYAKMNSHTTEKKEDLVVKTELLNKTRGAIMRRVVRNMNDSQQQSKFHSMPEIKESNYYVPEVKRSVNEFTNNREYVNPHLNHFIDSVSAFQNFAHTPIPKDTPKTIELPPQGNKKITIVFDLDQTLIHTQVMNWDTKQEDMDWGKTLQICTENGDYRINLKIRPHVVEVLNRLKEKFQIGIFTASQEYYGSKIIQELDPNNSIFSFKLYRQHCFEMYSRTGHVKDLRIFKNRDLSKVVLIDNSPHTYLFQKNNAVPIISFFNDTEDSEMLKLEKFLDGLQEARDVRAVLRDYFRLDQYHHYSNVTKLVKELY